MKKMLVFVSIILTIYSAVIAFPAFHYPRGIVTRYAAECQSTSANNMLNWVVDANSSMGKMGVILMTIQMLIVLALAYLSRKKQN